MFKLNKQKKDHRFFCGNKYDKYSIKKLKVGAASVLVGTGFLFGYNLDQVSANEQNTETTTIVTPKDGTELQSADKVEVATEPKQEKTPEVVTETPKSETKEEAVTATSPQVGETKEAPVTKETPETKEVSENKSNKVDQEAVNSSTLRANLADLEAQIERIRGNKKQASQIQNAEKLVAEAKQYLEASGATQQEVDAKAKEISSLTSILKSIKAEETVKENKNQDSRNGKKMEEGVGFRTDTAAGTGISADVKDATSTPAATRDGYTDRATAEALTKQITWLDFGDVANWQNVDNEGGRIYLKEGSIYKKEVISGYVINIKVKSLKPFQATEIYRKRMEAANASEEEKATFNPNATNQHFGDESGPSRVTANEQDGTWSEVRNNGINTGNKKTAIGAGAWSNIGVQFEISATYKGKNVRPAVIMNDSESANHGENIILTTNGSPWERVIELKKERFVGGTFTPTPYKPINNYNLRHEDYPESGGRNNAGQLLWHLRDGFLTFADGKKFAPKYMTNPDQEMGGLGTGVFGPVTSSGGYSLPILMTKDATEVGLYILSSGIQTAMMGVIPIDEGDAPESYGKASHTINTVNGVTGGEVKQPYLGSTRPDMDTGTTKDWYGDDNDIDADEGVNQLLPENLKGSEGNIIKANISKSGNYTLNVQAHTGGAEKAYIRSWIDFNKNGQFDADEASEIATITTDGTVKLNFKNKRSADVETLLEAGARVRIATEESEIENPTGTAFSGEVEDFIAKITHPPKGEKKTTVGNIKETQREEIHFTAQGKNVYLEDHPNAEIDTTVQPTYIDNKTGQEVTLASDGTYTVEGEGTYKFAISDNGKDVKVEFTPADGFVGKANGITIRRQDTNKTTTDWGTPDDTTLPNVNDSLNTMDGLYIPEVTVPTSVNATPVNAESQNLQGLPQKGKPTFNVETSPTPVTASAKYPAKLVDPRTNAVTELTTVDAFEQGTTNKIGTYTIVPETGEVTFTPNKDFKGIPAPVTISADVELTHDKNGNVTTKTLQATYSPTIIPVTPTATPSETVDIQGAEQSKEVTFTAGKATVNNEEVEVPMDTNEYKLLGEDGQPAESVPAKNPAGEVIGTYTLKVVDGKPTAVFTPTNKLYSGDVKPVTIQGKDTNGTAVTTTYTPRITPVVPTGTPVATEGIQGATQEGTPTFKPGNPNVPIDEEVAPTLEGVNPEGKVVVPGEGTYTVDKDGKVTFTPEPQFKGTAKGVTVKRVDKNGKPVTATYTPTVTPVTPEGTPAETIGIQGATQEGTPTFKPGNPNVPIDEEVAPTLEGANPEGKVVVPGEGTYTVDKDGKVTFTPEPQFTGTAKGVTVKRVDKNGTPVTATYTPTVTPVTPEGTPAETTGIQGATQEGTPTFKPGNPNVPIDETVVPTLEGANPEGKVVVPGEGTYTVDKDGKVTFIPEPQFTGVAKGVTVKRVDKNGTPVTATYTPTVTPVTPEGTPAETTGIQGATQEGTPTFKPGNPNVPIDETVVPTLEGANPEGKVVVPGEGTYTVDKDGKVTFIPEPQFTGVAKGVTVKRVDKNGTPVTAKYTPTVTPVTPEGTPAETTGIQGATQEGTPTFKPGNPNVPIDETVAPTLEGANPEGKVVVPGEGTYTVDKDGKVTFTPEPQFVGIAKGVTVKRVDKNGTPVTAKYTPTVKPVTPTGENSETEGPKAKPQTSTIVFDKKDQDNTTVNFDKGHENVALDPTTTTLVGKDGKPTTEVKVPGEGTYTLANNVITFTPEKDFAGKATGVTVQVKDANGTKVEKTYTPTVRPVTTFVDEAGNPITVDKNNTPVVPEEDGTQSKKDIPGYRFVETKKLPNGDTEHVYEKVKTSFKDKEGNEIPGNPSEDGEQPKKDIPGYRFVETKKLPNGDTEHVYEKVKTSFKDKEGNEIPGNPSEDGEQPKKDIPGYRFVETKKLPNGDTEHVYEKVTTPTPSVEKPRIIARDTEGNIIPGFEFDMLSPILDIPEYEYVGEEPLSDGTIKRIYKKVKKSTIPAKPYSPTPTQITEKVLTTFVDENGNVIIHEENGSHPGREIEGYELIGIKRDSRGNVRNVYRKIQSQKPVQPVEPATPAQPVQPTEVKEAEGKRELPNTGTEDNARLAALGLLGVLSGFGLVARKKKED